MEKNFNDWNDKKKRINKRITAPFYHQREIWWCALGVNIGTEQDGSSEEYRRPALILKGFGSKMCLIIPLTTSLHQHILRIPLGLVGGKKASALLSQMRIIDTKRLIRKIESLNIKTFEDIRKIVRELL